MRKMLFVTLLSILLILGVTPIGHAGNPGLPPPLGYEYGQLMGPEVTGRLKFWVNPSDGQDWLTFNGTCKSSSIYYNDPLPGVLQFVTEEWLLGKCDWCLGPQQLSFINPDTYPDCYPNKEGYINESPVIYKVRKFNNDDPTNITADIIGRFPVWVPINK